MQKPELQNTKGKLSLTKIHETHLFFGNVQTKENT